MKCKYGLTLVDIIIASLIHGEWFCDKCIREHKEEKRRLKNKRR